ncbi:LuxR C-terminal-related transcriptional regulator [Coleofasciculus sp. FACHB-SPT36]|uniref:LuxR C-terminal-related transcriptional regulator n=1 Tax=Cyanophyceae TaxID=3028117 RepID=UPI00168A4F9C|nr:LuxR C-terminal-related transcriptional regulator [Coleofasciculus sp. FACHB-SPT36]MBD2537389.1 LuxR family transcriptional regulator [Coleofasciculus sp. FACHB-SPT36]
MISLQLLFEAISQVKEEQDLRSQLVPKIGEYFAAKRSGIFFFDQLLGDRKFQKVLNVVLSIEHNPVARYLAERHTPVHEGLVTSPKAWAIICPRPDHWHVMAGPIIDRGQLIGSVGCTRDKSMPAFDAQDIADLSAICLHLSVWIASVRFAPSTVKDPILEPQHQPLKTHRLTSRELEIANLVALGRTNTEIGTELWITENSVKQALKRMFRKLEVSSRTEMVAQLFATQHAFPSAKPSPSNLALNAHQ